MFVPCQPVLYYMVSVWETATDLAFRHCEALEDQFILLYGQRPGN